MSKKCGIIGLPNVGKSLLFNKLTKSNKAQSENYPFCTIDPNIGLLTYEDEKLTKLGNFGKSRKIIYSSIELYDIAGLVKNASKGEGLGNQFLSDIRKVNAIIHVVRGFENDDVIHVMNRIDPVDDYCAVQFELIAADIKHIDTKIAKVKPAEVKELENLKILVFESINTDEFNVAKYHENHNNIVKTAAKFGLDLLSIKPQLILINGQSKDMEDFCRNNYLSFVSLNIDSMNQTEINKVCEEIYNKLNLICFFTTGEIETRAWMIQKGTNAKDASGEIHSDFPKRFIKAEVTSYEKYFTGARPNAVNGTYVVENCDIINFLIGK